MMLPVMSKMYLYCSPLTALKVFQNYKEADRYIFSEQETFSSPFIRALLNQNED